MTTIDRYLVWQFLRVFLVTFVSLLGIYVMADSVSHRGEFVQMGSQSGSLWLSLINYYTARVPLFFELTGRIITLLATVFTIAWMQRNNEMTALMAAGISRWRIVMPLVIVGVIVSLSAVANREIGVPSVRSMLCANAKELSRQRIDKLTPRYDNETGIRVYGEAIMPHEDAIINPRFRLPFTWSKMGRTLNAERAEFQEAQQGRPAGYLFHGVTNKPLLREIPSFSREGQPIIFSPFDQDWLAEDECFVVSNLRLEQLRRGMQWQQYSSTGQLIAGLHNRSVDFGSDVRVLVHMRFVQPILDIVLLFLGLPFVVSAQRSSVFMATGKTMLVVVFFSVVVLSSQAMGIHCVFSPAFAAWAPVLLLAPMAVLLSSPLQT